MLLTDVRFAWPFVLRAPFSHNSLVNSLYQTQSQRRN
jgi:hypothetical protein